MNNEKMYIITVNIKDNFPKWWKIEIHKLNQ